MISSINQSILNRYTWDVLWKFKINYEEEKLEVRLRTQAFMVQKCSYLLAIVILIPFKRRENPHWYEGYGVKCNYTINTGFGQYSTEVYLHWFLILTFKFRLRVTEPSDHLALFIHEYCGSELKCTNYIEHLCNNIILDAGLDHLLCSALTFPGCWDAKGGTKSYNFSSR